MGGTTGQPVQRRQDLPVSGLRPDDRAGVVARCRVAAGRRGQPAALAYAVLARPVAPRHERATVEERTPLWLRSVAEIRANTVLPAKRERLTLHTTDGLALVGEIALPESAAPVATLVTLHPLPTHGGMMDSHLFRKAANRLPALADLAVLRFNTRGTESD